MEENSLRVAHVFAGTEGGSWVFDQLQALKVNHGCDVVAVLGGDEGSLPDKCRAAGIPVKGIDFRITRFWSLPMRFLKLAFWLRRERIDVVQSHVVNSTMFARPAAWLADIPVRLTMVTGTYYMLAPFYRRSELRTCWMETGIIPSCQLSADLYRQAGVPESLICETLYYGPSQTMWDPAKAQPAGLRQRFGIDPNAPLIGVVAMLYARVTSNPDFCPPGCAGRLIKGHEDLIAAMPLILREFPGARMLFMGKGWGPEADQIENELRGLIAAAGMERNIVMTGYIGNIAGAYLELDVSVQASLNENLGGTVESLLMARPTVVTRVGGMPDAVADGETGVLVNPADPADLARGICEMLRSPARASQLGAAGRERMLAGFTIESTAPGLAALYARQFAGAKGSRRLSRLLLRTASAPARFIPEVLMTLKWALRLTGVYTLHFGKRMIPGNVRAWRRRVIGTERKPGRAN